MLSPDIEERLKRLEDITDYRSIRVSPTIKCISCGVYIFLDTDVYRDVEDIDIRCKACKGVHRGQRVLYQSIFWGQDEIISTIGELTISKAS